MMKINLLSARALILFVSLIACGGIAQAQSSLPAEDIRNADAAIHGSTIAILNGDDTISIFDTKTKSYTLERFRLPESIGSVGSITMSPDGTYFAVMHGSKDILVSIFRLGGSGAALVDTHYIGESLDRGRVTIKFSNNEEKVYITYGERLLYIFSLVDGSQVHIEVGTLPMRIAEASSERLLVLNEESETLNVIDTTANKVLSTIKLGASPQGLLYNPVVDQAFVSNVGSDDVYVIDIDQGKVIQQIPVGSDPTAMDFNPRNGETYVVSNSSGQLNVISPDFKVNTFELGSAAYFKSAPFDMAFNMNQQKLYLLNTTESKYLVYDSQQKKIVKIAETPSFPVEVFSPEGSESALFWHWGANSLMEIDRDTLTASYVSAIDGGDETWFAKPQSITIDEATNRAFVSNRGADFITVLNTETLELMGKIPGGKAIQNIFITESPKKLYAVSPADSTVQIIDISSPNYPSTVLELEQQSRGGAQNETTNRMYFSNAEAASISVIDMESDQITGTIKLPDGSLPIVDTVDEKRNVIYVALYGGNGIAVIDGATNQVSRIIPTKPNPLFVRYIPELDKLFAAVEGGGELLTIDPSSDTIQTIPLSGEPYRIFFDATTHYVYVNRRNENLVTAIAFDDSPKGYRIVREQSMPFWGETDARPYNMVSFHETANQAFFTSINNEIVVVDVLHDKDGIVYGDWYASIEDTGQVLRRSDNTGGEPVNAETRQRLRTFVVNNLASVYALLIALFAAVVLTLLFVIKKRFNNSRLY